MLIGKIHISEIVPGDVLRISLKPGKALDPFSSARGHQSTLHTRNGAPRAANGFSRSVILGFVTANDTETGILSLQVEARGGRREHLAATVKYAEILTIQKYVAAKIIPEIPVGASGHAIRHPGILAKGSTNPYGFMNLIRVYF